MIFVIAAGLCLVLLSLGQEEMRDDENVHINIQSAYSFFHLRILLNKINNLRKLLIEFVYFKQNIVFAAASYMPRAETITRAGT